VKIPKHITDAHGRPRAKCPTCGKMVEVSGAGKLVLHKRPDDAVGWIMNVCEGTSTPAPDGFTVAWLKGQMESELEWAKRARKRAADESAQAEAREKRAAELEKLLERASS